jgi:ribosomal protein L30E
LRVALQAGKVHMGDSQIRTALTGLARVIVLALKDKTDAA